MCVKGAVFAADTGTAFDMSQCRFSDCFHRVGGGDPSTRAVGGGEDRAGWFEGMKRKGSATKDAERCVLLAQDSEGVEGLVR